MPTLREQTEQYFGTTLENWHKLQEMGSAEGRALQFNAEQPYNARQGEFRNPYGLDNIIQDMAGSFFNFIGGVFGGGDENAVGQYLHQDRDRVARNTRIQEQNLLSRWNYSGAGIKLLGHTALKHNINGEAYVGLGTRQLDADEKYTTELSARTRLLDNRDGYQEDYKLRYYSALGIGQGSGGPSNATPPSPQNVRKSAEAGFNAGQINPIRNNKLIWKTKFEESVNLDAGNLDLAEGFSLWLDGILETGSNSRLAALNAELDALKIETMTKVSEGSVGFARIPIPFLAPVNLTSLLQQNLIVPPDVHGLRNPPEGSQAPIPSTDTFDQLYLQNKSVIDVRGTVRNSNGDIVRSDTPRDPKGTIAGVPIPDLEGAMLSKSGGTYSPNDSHKVFDFEEDKRKYSENRVERGFIQNIAGSVQQGGLMPAVENEKPGQNEGVPNDPAITMGKAAAQQFPFMFETINKTGSIRSGKRVNPAYNQYFEDFDALAISLGGGELGEQRAFDRLGDAPPAFLDVGNNVEHKQYCYFQATLSNISETFSPTWSAKHFFGRSEQIHSYTMTDRSIELTFVVFATEIRRLQNLYERINWLAQQTYASYDAEGRQKAGPIIRMTIGDMFANLNGFIRSLSYDWNYLGAGGKWEITEGLRIPMACSVNMSFQVLHTRMPDRNHAFYPGPMFNANGLGTDSVRGSTGTAPFTDAGPLITVGPDKNADPSDVIARNNVQEMYINQIGNAALDDYAGQTGEYL